MSLLRILRVITVSNIDVLWWKNIDFFLLNNVNRTYDFKNFLKENEHHSPNGILQIRFLIFFPHNIYFFIEKCMYFDFYLHTMKLLYPTSLSAWSWERNLPFATSLIRNRKRSKHHLWDILKKYDRCKSDFFLLFTVEFL